MVAALPARFGRRRLGRVALEPAVDEVVVVLLAPQQPGEGLALHVAQVVGHVEGRDAAVEGVGLGDALREQRVEVRAQRLPAACRRR